MYLLEKRQNNREKNKQTPQHFINRHQKNTMEQQQQQQPQSIESIEQEIKQLVDNDKTISCIQHPMEL